MGCVDGKRVHVVTFQVQSRSKETRTQCFVWLGGSEYLDQVLKQSLFCLTSDEVGKQIKSGTNQSLLPEPPVSGKCITLQDGATPSKEAYPSLEEESTSVLGCSGGAGRTF